MLPKLFFFICILIFSFIFTTHSYNTQCLHHQKTLLLQLRNELKFNSSISTKLVQWNQSDECCKWYGVECDAAGYINTLQLDDESISGGMGDSSSLFRLKYLEKLNLANNDFNYSNPIPKGISNLIYLTHLNLSRAHFDGQVPAEILSLKRLVSLDISSYFLKLEYPNLEMVVQNLTGIKELYLDSVYITSSVERKKWSHIISSYLPNLTALSMADCYLYGPLSKTFWQLHSLSILQLDYNDLSRADPDLFANFSSLTILSLQSCSLKGSFSNMIFHIPSLQYLDLSDNKELSGSILSDCQFTESIPFTFPNLTELSYVDLSNNLFTGSLSSSLFGGLSNLVYLDLRNNSFTGYIPQSLFGLPSLKILYLGNNHFMGQVEEFHIVNVSNIAILDLSGNRLEGPIPDSFYQLKSLESFSLSGNLFNGTFQLDKIHSRANLRILDLSDNNLSVNSSTYGFPRLEYLSLASCNMCCNFPNFIKHSDMLVDLNMSNNRIIGEIPSWIWERQLRYLDLSFNLLTHLQRPYNISASLTYIDLSSNQLRGDLHLLIPPNITYSLHTLLLGNNSLSGSIPTSLCTVTYFIILDLSVNKLRASIPSCLLHDIGVLNLGKNNFSGRIPDNFSLDCSLLYLDLNNNTLEGKIPKSLQRCKLLQFMNVGNNKISLSVLVLHSNRFHGEIRCHSSWPELQILDISSNHFSGRLESINFSSWTVMVLGTDAQLSWDIFGDYSFSGFGVTIIIKGLDMLLVKILPQFNAIDFSSNNFIGEIPNAIGDLNSLHHLNFSNNTLDGSIPKSFGQLSNLESLDLSRNQLSGAIPMELAGLTFLEVLNLSYNKLVGMIPNGRQLQTFSADSFEGNLGLCGFPLNISCSGIDDSDISPSEDDNEQENGEIEWEYVCAALGYVVGLGIIVWLLLFCRSFREKYFGKIEEVVEDIFIAREMRRRRARRAIRNRARRQ